MDTFSSCLAFGPLALYLLQLGSINLSRRPLVVSGTRETLALALALAGLVIVGPLRLFMPEEAATQFGGIVWILLVSFYALVVALAILLSPPRLVVYNVGLGRLRAILAETAARLDDTSSWAGKALCMPQLHVQLRLESFPPTNNVSLVATGYEQGSAGWRRLAAALRRELRHAQSESRAHGMWMVACALLILVTLALRVAYDPQNIAQGMSRLFNP